jgi:hypothetical protein
MANHKDQRKKGKKKLKKLEKELARRLGPSQVRHGDLYHLRIYLQEASDPQVYPQVKHVFWQVKGTVLTVLQMFPETNTYRYLYWPREQIIWYQTTPQRFEDVWQAQRK